MASAVDSSLQVCVRPVTQSLLQSFALPSPRAIPGSWKLGLLHSSSLLAIAIYLIWDLLLSQRCYRVCTNTIFCNLPSSFSSLQLHTHKLGSQSDYFPCFQSTHTCSCKSGLQHCAFQQRLHLHVATLSISQHLGLVPADQLDFGGNCEASRSKLPQWQHRNCHVNSFTLALWLCSCGLE